jgi:hypothetical protein
MKVRENFLGVSNDDALIMMSQQVDQLLGKQEKMGKVVARVKFLLEKEEGAASNSNKGKAAANSKMEIAKVGETSALHLQHMIYIINFCWFCYGASLKFQRSVLRNNQA